MRFAVAGLKTEFWKTRIIRLLQTGQKFKKYFLKISGRIVAFAIVQKAAFLWWESAFSGENTRARNLAAEYVVNYLSYGVAFVYGGL